MASHFGNDIERSLNIKSIKRAQLSFLWLWLNSVNILDGPFLIDSGVLSVDDDISVLVVSCARDIKDFTMLVHNVRTAHFEALEPFGISFPDLEI